MCEAQGKPAPRDTTNLYVRYDGRFEVGARDANGRLTWHGPYPTVGQARDRRAKLIAKRVDGEPEPTNRRLTFDEAAGTWWTTHATAKRENTRPSTVPR